MQIIDDRQLRILMTAAHHFAIHFGQRGLSEPEDIAQIAMLRLLSKNDGRAPSLRWLRKVVRSIAYDTGRAYAREQRFLPIQSLDALEVHTIDRARPIGRGDSRLHSSNPSESLAVEDERILLATLLKQLTPAHRHALVLQSEGHSYQRIGQLTGSNVGTVRSRIHYARMKARELLKGVV
ncbi:MAG: RNA polymerase sigma factor [Cyanobacteria bacterium]|nr:RNA polymerase sigma factor [Cyanobacteriota bacterium]